MPKQNLWLDCDGVLLSWVPPFLDHIKSPVGYNELSQYDLSVLFDSDKDRMRKAIDEFNSSEKYEYLKPLVSREELLKLKIKGYELNVISQVDGNLAREYRISNLDKRFGEGMFKEIILTSHRQKKAEILDKLEPIGVIHVVEDNPGFFPDALGYMDRFKGYAIAHPYNRKELEGFTPIYNGMSEFVRHMCS